tara:strand:- start:213 stop:578 length:366 start_codon:yes stop_codon:yes gene_type:complete
MQITLTFSKPLNCSVSPGDTVYYTPVSLGGGFSVAQTSTMQELGTVVSVSDPYLQPKLVISNNTMSVAPTITAATFISFRKNNKVNLTSLKGYFAEAKFENNSKEKAELFAVGSEIVQSSK